MRISNVADMGSEGSNALVSANDTLSSQDGSSSRPTTPARDWRCHVCFKPLPADPKAVTLCKKCSAPFHPGCVARTTVLPTGGFKKCCGDPIITQSMLRISEDSVVSRLSNELSTSLRQLSEDMKSSIQDLKSSIQSLDTRMSDIEQQAQSFHQQCENLSSRLVAIEERPQPSLPPNELEASRLNLLASNANDLVQELDDRARRACNLIAFNIPERRTPNDELVKFNEILSSLGLAPRAKFVKRIGSARDGNTRPLKAFFPSSADVILVLKRRPDFVRNSIQVRGDLTPAQRDYLKTQRAQLNTRINAGEVNLTIRYIRGTPTIVPKNLQTPGN